VDRIAFGEARRRTRFCVSGQVDDFDLSVWTIGRRDAPIPALEESPVPDGPASTVYHGGTGGLCGARGGPQELSPSNQDDTDASVGVKVGAGVACQFTKLIAMFGEYRDTHFSPEFTFRDNAIGSATLSSNIYTHYLLMGVSFRF
jgi:opacity protein-like surface antigen